MADTANNAVKEVPKVSEPKDTWPKAFRIKSGKHITSEDGEKVVKKPGEIVHLTEHQFKHFKDKLDLTVHP